MAFTYTALGPMVATDPKGAAEKLTAGLVEHGGSLTALHEALKVDYRTLTRWLSRLLDAGYDVRESASLELARRAADVSPDAKKVARPASA